MKNFRNVVLFISLILCFFCFTLGISACSLSDNENNNSEINTDFNVGEADDSGSTDNNDTDSKENNTDKEEPHIHSFGEWIITEEASCTQAGSKVSYCDCGEAREEIISAYGHNIVEHTAQSPTCSQDGWNSYEECVRCGYNDKELISKIDHIVTEWLIEIQPDCVSAGSRIKKCTMCNSIMQNESLPVLGHNFGDWILTEQATCTKDGSEKRVCSRDEGHIEIRTVNKLSHADSGWLVETAPDCETAGKSYKQCTNCFAVLEEKTVPSLGHGYGEWTVKTAATCTDSGEEVRICSHDEKHCESRTIQPLGHSIVKKTVIQPSCGIEGTENAVCTICNIILETVAIPALEHSYGEWAEYEKATCLAEGVERRYCIYDESHYEERKTPKVGHSAGEWAVSIEPSCEDDGKRVNTCELCGEEIQSETIPATGHSYTDNVCTNCHIDFGGTKGLKWLLSADGGSYTLCGIGNTEECDIVVPSIYNGKPVTEIADEAFMNCNILKSIFISENIVRIGSRAFYNSSLENIRFSITSGWTMTNGEYSILLEDHYFEKNEFLFYLQNEYYGNFFLIRD